MTLDMPALSAFVSEAEDVSVRFGGRLVVPALKTMLEPRAAGGDWCINGGAGGFEVDADGAYHFKLYPNQRPEIAATMRVASPTAGVIRIDYVFTPKADLTLLGGFVSAKLKYDEFAGGHLLADGKRVEWPKGMDAFKLPCSGCRRLEVVRGRDGARLAFEVVSLGGAISIQNNRPWNSETASVRIGFPHEPDGLYKGGKGYPLSIVMRGAGSLDPHQTKSIVISAGSDWVPIKMRGGIVAGSALDFSKIRGTEAPAGKYGRVVTKGAHFEFERLPGVNQRFYGANVCFSANVPPKDAARRFAEDFARRGYNALRIHHHEKLLVEGMNDPAALTFNPKAIDRFDALVAACVSNGIYLTTDLFVSRKPITYRALSIDKPGVMPTSDYKFYVPVHPGAWSNFCAWTRLFLTHRNPYTGRTLAEEPALVCLSLVNEGPLNAKDGGFYSSVPEWKAAWLNWIAVKRAKEPAKWGKVRDEMPPFYTQDMQGAAFLAFLADVERDFAARVRQLVHGELKCPVSLANMNNGDCLGLQGVRDAAYEYVDDHFYIDHPSFPDKAWSLPSESPNVNPVMNPNLGALGSAMKRAFGKPFAVSEYNFCGPGRFRGVGGFITAAEGALQDWSALWRFAWSHSDNMLGNLTRGGVGYFDAAGDPLAHASDRASICLFLRGDLAPLKAEYPIRLPGAVPDVPDPLMAKSVRLPWTWATWYRRVGMTLKDRPGQISVADAYAKGTAQVRSDLGLPADEGVWPVAGDGTLVIDPKVGTFNLSTPCTSGGFTGNREIRSASLDATLDGQAATVWASALDDAPIATSRRLLVTHLPDVQNDRVTYADPDLKILLSHGRNAPMMRVCKASIVLRCAGGAWKVYALGVDGSRRSEVLATYSDGALRFVSDTAADPTDATFLYELVR